MQPDNLSTFGPAWLISEEMAVLLARNAALDADGVERELVYFRAGPHWTCMPSLGVGCQLVHDIARREVLVVTSDGLVQVIGGQGVRTELIDPSPEGPSNLQRILGVSRIGSAVYAYGMCRQVYRRSDDSTWERADAGIRIYDVAGIKSMCGHDEREIYAVGFNGEIWIREDGRWISVDSPTRVKLEHVTAAAAGDYVACGGAGIVLRGSGRRWTRVPQSRITDTIWSVAEFEGALYMSTTTRLLTLQKGELEDVTGLPADARTFSYLATSKSSLWSIGHLDLLELKGQSWTRIEPPANV